MRNKFILHILLLIVLSFQSCKKSHDEPVIHNINPNIRLIVDHIYSDSPVNIPCAVWLPSNDIYTVNPFGVCKLTSEFVPSYTLLGFQYDGLYIDADATGNRLLRITPNFYDQTFGALYEYDINKGNIVKLFDSTNNISSARYYRDTLHIIYYSYGNPIGVNAGYFLFDKVTKRTDLLYSFFRAAGPIEFVNGFDIHPTEPMLIIPVVTVGESPKIIEFNIKSKEVDTLKVSFDLSWNRICLWLRYNKTGDKILYSCYPRGSGLYSPGDDSEIGIIDRTNLKKTILDANTNKYYKSLNICPQWSPDEKNIIYSSASLTYDGARSNYYLYLLKNIFINK